MNQKIKGKFVRKYFERLTASDYIGIIEMFEGDGWVDSPFLGKLPASKFFTKLGKASSRNILTVHDILFGEHGDSVAAQFVYDWTLESGDKIIFQGVDYFKFGVSGRFASMSIFYDTYPTREGVGDNTSRLIYRKYLKVCNIQDSFSLKVEKKRRKDVCDK